MRSHVFPKGRPSLQRWAARVSVALLASALTCGIVRAQEETETERPAPAVDATEGRTKADAAAKADDPASPVKGPPAIGESFPKRLPIRSVGSNPSSNAAARSRPGGADAESAGAKDGGANVEGGGTETPGAEAGPAVIEEDRGLLVATLAGDEPRPLVVVFWSAGCVVCNRYGGVLEKLIQEIGDRAAVVLVVSGAAEEPEKPRAGSGEAGAADSRTAAGVLGDSVPPGLASRVTVYRDEGGAAAARLAVRVTPTAFVLDAKGVLRYRGPIDDDRRARPRDARPLLTPALQAVVAGREVETADVPPFGTAIR